MSLLLVFIVCGIIGLMMKLDAGRKQPTGRKQPAGRIGVECDPLLKTDRPRAIARVSMKMHGEE